jgi:hypothetical protein
MIGDLEGDIHRVRGTGIARTSDVLHRGKLAVCLALLLHAGAAVLMLATETSAVGMTVFLLVWIMLNGLWLILLRRPFVAALLSLAILLVLTLLSRFKFEKLWMTIDFLDVMIVDRDTTAFLLDVFPGLRWWILLAAVATAIAIVIELPGQSCRVLGVGRGTRCGVAVLVDRPQRGFRGPKLRLEICPDRRRGSSRTFLARISRSGDARACESDNSSRRVRLPSGTQASAHHPAAR